MKVLVYPADEYGCGHHRLIWPTEVLRLDGHDVTYVRQGDRRLQFQYDGDVLRNVNVPEGTDVVVFQRITDARVLPAITWLREHHVAVVMDVDDDLSAIHRNHPAFMQLNPNRAKHMVQEGVRSGLVRSQEQADAFIKSLSAKHTHSWHNLEVACQLSTLVTVSTAGLLKRYVAHGRGRILDNYVPDHYLDIEHVDSDVIGWPAALQSHPDDPDVIGPSIACLVREGRTFISIGDPTGMGQAFGLPEDPKGENVDLDEWPHALARLGVGIAPLADTLFNSRKSWLKPLEMSAVGVPWIASPRAEYRRLHALGAGILAAKPKVWYRELANLANNPARRAELSEAGRRVAAGLRLSDNAWRHLEAWSDAYEIERGTRRSG